MSEIVTLVQTGGAVAFTVIAWYLERRERLKLERKFEDCLRHLSGKR